MWQELAEVGVRPLTTAEAVDEVLTKREGTALVVVNSVLWLRRRRLPPRGHFIAAA